jgi:hypothetical protein
MSVIESGVTVEMLVMTGAPRDCADKIDSGKSRSAGDALAIRGIANSNNIAAIASRILSFEVYGKKSVTGRGHYWVNGLNPSKAAVIEYSISNIDYISNLYSRAAELYKSCSIRILAPSEIGFLMYILKPEATANDFLSKVVLGIGVLEHTPELALRRILEKTRITKELHYSANDLTNFIFIAFEKSIKGEQ